MPFDSWQRKLGELPARILGNDVQLSLTGFLACLRALRAAGGGFVHGRTRGIQLAFFLVRSQSLVHLVSKQLLLQL